MKRLLTALLLLCFFNVTAQFKSGKVILKDSTELKGLIKLKTFGGIKFKQKKYSEDITSYDHTSIIGVNIEGKRYCYVAAPNGKSPKLLQVIINGDMTLYAEEVAKTAVTPPNGIGSPEFLYTGDTFFIYYIHVGDKLLKAGKKLKGKHVALFEGCPKLIDKIKRKDLKKSELYKIVNYYNTKCKH